jgi:hypothetical protein
MLRRIIWRVAILLVVLPLVGHGTAEAQDECNCREVCRNSRDPQCVSECRRACDASDSPSCRQICADQCARTSCNMGDCIRDCNANPCPEGLDYCFSARKCVNLSNDRGNCGKCGNACNVSQNCCPAGGTGRCVENSRSSCGPDCNTCGPRLLSRSARGSGVLITQLQHELRQVRPRLRRRFQLLSELRRPGLRSSTLLPVLRREAQQCTLR